ncbi:MAG: hypothetical protein WD795_03975 [Woeseia sp.]
MGRALIMAAAGFILGAAATIAAFQHGLIPLPNSGQRQQASA